MTSLEFKDFGVRGNWAAGAMKNDRTEQIDESADYPYIHLSSRDSESATCWTAALHENLQKMRGCQTGSKCCGSFAFWTPFIRIEKSSNLLLLVSFSIFSTNTYIRTNRASYAEKVCYIQLSPSNSTWASEQRGSRKRRGLKKRFQCLCKQPQPCSICGSGTMLAV